MIVIAIIAILATILIVQWLGARDAAFRTEAQTIARNIALATQIYYAENELNYDNMDMTDLADIESTLGTLPAGVTVTGSGSGQTFSFTVTARDSDSTTFTVTQDGLQ